jgi:hypothetical protein
MLQRDVIGAIPVDRKVLLIADVPVCAGSFADGVRVADVDNLAGVRVVAVTGNGRTRWSPPPDRELATDDRLTVVATRDGLGRAVAATSA